MDLYQRKLTKTEWCGIEIPESLEEKKILKLIIKCYHNVSYKENDIISLNGYLKILITEELQNHLFITYFDELIRKSIKKYNLPYEFTCKVNKTKIKKADTIRIQNLDGILKENNSKIWEFMILNIINNLLKNSDKIAYYYYSLLYFTKLHVADINPVFNQYVVFIINHYKEKVKITNVIYNAVNILEKNEYVYKYADRELYDHQKKLFTCMKNSSPQLVLYTAPTGTGKTLSPLGLSEQYRIIFVCAARHVGLALAKSCISVGKKVAFAFGCESAADIRLHYFAATDYTRDWKTGGIRKVDNSVGDKVEIIISDIKSYLCAMSYMQAFNKTENIIMYWDEPTITLDYETHELHEHISKIWRENEIQKIILSSATLPKHEEIQETIADFRCKFPESTTYSINSHDCKKSISLLSKDNYVMLPHYICETYDELVQSANHCLTHMTLLRYLDLHETIKFIKLVQEYMSERYKIENYFENIQDINMSNIKIYYLTLLSNMTQDIWDSVVLSKTKKYNNSINITTSDAHTLTDGPTIYLADNIDKIGKFCIQSAKIPGKVVEDLQEDIDYNNKLATRIGQLEQKFEDGCKKDEHKEKKMADIRLSSDMKILFKEIEQLRGMTKKIELHDLFVPNKSEHLNRWAPENRANVFSCDIESKTVEKIMLLENVDDTWKLLLLMGIGVFKVHNSVAYTELMKELATQQKLFIIIASTDFIYGTNYQFCHGYIGKDLENLSQEKAIQSLGRVGRSKYQQTYSVRFRDDNLIKKIFLPEEHKPEVINMNKLFNSDYLN
jgi:hypothetical protein